MSATLATVADSLIEFILSLMQDPQQAQNFNDHPEKALASYGLSGISASDVCAVAPVIAENPHVAPSPQPSPPRPGGSTVVREIHNITNNLSYIDARSTIIDQSTNQNIWAHGDVTQTFDQSAVVASGDGSLAAGNGVAIDNSQDHSTHITAGGNANVGNSMTSTDTSGSYNTSTDASTSTNNSTNIDANDSLNNTSTDVTADHSGNTTTASTDTTNTNVNSNTVSHSTDSAAVQYQQTQDAGAAATDPSSTSLDSSSTTAPVVEDHTLDDTTHH